MYQVKKNWQYDEVVTEQDMNRIESGIEENQQSLTTHLAEKASLEKAGHVQLSNKIDGTSESLAITERALSDLFSKMIKLDGDLITSNHLLTTQKTPSSYPSYRTTWELVNSEVFKLPAVMGMYSVIMTERAWSDSSGGNVRQVAYSKFIRRTMIRFGNILTDIWDDWTSMLDESMVNIPWGVAGLDGNGKLPGLYTPDTLVAGDSTDLINITDWRSMGSTQKIEWVMAAGLRFAQVSGTVRITYKAGVLNGGGTGFFNVFKNSSPVGVERTVDNTNQSVIYVEDFTVKKGDTLAVYCRFHKDSTYFGDSAILNLFKISVKGDTYRA